MSAVRELFHPSHLHRTLISALLIFFVLLFPVTRPVDPDVWFHLSAGRHLWNHGEHPGLERFLYTFPEDGSSNHHEWLFQFLLYPLYRFAGMESLVALKTLLVAVPFLLLFFSSVTRTSFYPGLFYLLAAYAAGSGRFFIRPEIAGVLCMVVMWRLLSRPLTLKRGLLVVLLQVFWTNLHWSSILGVALVSAFAVADLLGQRGSLPFDWISGTGCARRAGYLYLLGSVFAATAVNPDGLSPLVEPLRFFFGTDFLLPIDEVRPTYHDLFKRGMHSHHAWYFAALAFAILAIGSSWRRMNLAHLFTFLGLALAGMSAFRHVLFFSMISVPIVLRALSSAPDKSVRPRSRPGELFAAAAAAVFLTTITLNKITGVKYLIPYPKLYQPLSADDSELLWPHRAAAFVVAEDLPERVFNNFNSGNFLNWAIFPRRIYVNGTLFHRPTEVEYAALRKYPDRWSEISRKWGFETAFFRLAPVIAPSKLIRLLLHQPGWELAYYDGTAAIFLKESPENQELTERFAVDLEAELLARAASLEGALDSPLSAIPLWREIAGYRWRRDQADHFRLRGRFYLLADRPDLADKAADLVRRLGG